MKHNAVIWRYMDIDKYTSLLKKRALFFCRADKFSDPFEGTIPKREAEFRIEESRLRAEYLGNTFDEEVAKANIEGLIDLHKRYKRGVIINCWHINNNESDAMWRLYLKDNEGVAIQSNVQRINQAFEKAKEQIEFSKVRYLDYENSIWYHPIDYPHKGYNLLTPFFHKRMEFCHEKEYRIYHQIYDAIDNPDYWETQEHNKGKFIDVDLNILIEKIYLPPTIDNSTYQNIVSLTNEYGYDFVFEKSKLQSEPYY
ncbi:DUF2971 domain-containing protein [Pontibacter sp. BT213]|uniref:DUF2971 domain-containing protein n=1 Tax=Pontibacter fetidus TaxID=2700082 RepID=A0A6B2GUI4_9BACT|nr:DUF2971 domain-containing protein [Pontibacter fetidus]